MTPTIPGGRGWRVLADGLLLIAIGTVLPARQFNLMPVEIWQLMASIVGVGVVVCAYKPIYGLRAVLSVAVPFVMGLRAVAVLTAHEPELWVFAAVLVMLGLHIVAALAPGEELKP